MRAPRGFGWYAGGSRLAHRAAEHLSLILKPVETDLHGLVTQPIDGPRKLAIVGRIIRGSTPAYPRAAELARCPAAVSDRGSHR